MDEDELRRKNEELIERRKALGITETPMRPIGKDRSVESALLKGLEAKPLPKCRLCGEPAHYGDECHACRARRIEARQKAQEEAERRRFVENIEEHLISVGVLQEHTRAQLTDFPVEIQALARSFLDDENSHGLLITGMVGTGKTHLLVAILREMVLDLGHISIREDGGAESTPKRRSVTYCLVRTLFRRLWATYRDEADESETAVVEAFTRAPILALDDLGHEGRVSDAVVGTLHEIISTRNGNYLPTIVTTNLTLAEISHDYGAAIASRIGSWFPIVLTGEDRRNA